MQQKLQRRQPLLTVNNGSLLHQTGWLLNLLQNNGAKKVGMMFAIWLTKNSLRQALALGGLPATMRVEVDQGIAVLAKTVGELRKMTAWLENLAIITPQERRPESANKG